MKPVRSPDNDHWMIIRSSSAVSDPCWGRHFFEKYAIVFPHLDFIFKCSKKFQSWQAYCQPLQLNTNDVESELQWWKFMVVERVEGQTMQSSIPILAEKWGSDSNCSICDTILANISLSRGNFEVWLGQRRDHVIGSIVICCPTAAAWPSSS